MSQTSKVLIAYDGSKYADMALTDLKHAGLGEKVQARVITVADPWIPPIESVAVATDVVFAGSFAMAREQTQNALQGAKTLAEKVAARLRKEFPGWTISASGVVDSPAHGILNAAEKWKPTLIVLGSKGHSDLERLLLGSVSHKVLSHAACNVRIARGTAAKVAASPRVVLAVDGSKDAQKMLQAVANRSWHKNTEFRLIVVLDYKLSLIQDFQNDTSGKKLPRKAIASTVAQSRLPDRLLEQALLVLKAKGLHATLVEREGDPRTEIAKEVKRFKANTLFVGSRGLHAVQRFFLGSVSLNLAEHAGCTVEVVR